MNRGLRQLYIFRTMLISSITTMRRQKMTPAILILLFFILLALVFAFLAFAPVLSPFIYPLF